MKPKLLKQTSLFVSLLHLSMGGAHAATGTWTSTATSGNWADIANWNGGAGPIADDFNSTANFTSNITAATTVSLTGGTDRTIGNIVFSDAGAAGSAWVISSSGSEQLILGDNAGATLTPTITATTNATINSIIAGNDGLTKQGAGTLTLNGANTYTGLTRVLGGVTTYSNTASSLTLGSAAKINGNLQLGNGTALGASVLKMGAANQFATTSVLDFRAAGFPHQAVLKLMGFSQTVGGLTSNVSTENVIQNAEGEAFTGSSVLTIDTAGSNYSFNGTIRNKWDSTSTGTLGITKTGLGTQTLSGATNYTGTTRVSGGTLELGAGANINSVGVIIEGSSSVLKLTGNTNGTGSGALSIDGGTFNNSSAGINQTLSGFSTITMNNGTLTAGVANTSTWGAFHFNGGAKTITATGNNNIISGTGVIGFQANAVVTLSPTNATDIINVTGSIGVAGQSFSVAGGITKAGLGTIVLSGANLYTGATKIDAGTLSASNIVVSAGASNLGNAATAVTLGSAGAQGTLSYTGNTATYIRGFTIGGAGGGRLDVTDSTKTLTVGTGGVTGTGLFTVGGAGNTEITSNITHSGGLTKVDGGTLTLTGTKGYTGATNVNGGKLVINGSISTSSLTTVNNTGTLGGAGTVGALTVASGGTLAPGNSPGILNAGNTDLQSGSNLNMELSGLTVGTQYDQLNVTGSVSLAGALNLTVGFAPVNGNLLFILANDGADAISGAFNGLANNGIYNLGGQDFQISYFGNQTSPGVGTFTGGNDVVLMAVPEPAAALLGGLGLLALLRRRRN